MSWEALTAVVSVASVVVLAAAAIAAVIQIRHLRAGNQLEGFLEVSRELESPELLTARAFVELELADRLKDGVYREELVSGTFDLMRHPEVRIANFWEKMGALIRHGVLDAPLFFDFFAHRCALRWEQLRPVVELMRQRDAFLWVDFEHIAGLCQRYLVSGRRGGSW
jgi:hypothetical protein